MLGEFNVLQIKAAQIGSFYKFFYAFEKFSIFATAPKAGHLRLRKLSCRNNIPVRLG